MASIVFKHHHFPISLFFNRNVFAFEDHDNRAGCAQTAVVGDPMEVGPYFFLVLGVLSSVRSSFGWLGAADPWPLI